MTAPINPHSPVPQRIARIVLESGGISRRDLAAKAGISSAYAVDILDALKDSGIVGCTRNGNRTIWCRPADVERLTAEIALGAMRRLAERHRRYEMRKREQARQARPKKQAAKGDEVSASVPRSVWDLSRVL